MTAILAPVVVTCPDMPLLRRFYLLVIFGPPSLKIAFLPSDLVMSAKSTNGKCTRLLLHCTLLLPSALFPNGALIICPVTLTRLGGMGISSLSLIISQNGPRRCLHYLKKVTQWHNICSIMLFHDSESLKLSSLITASISVIIWWLN